MQVSDDMHGKFYLPRRLKIILEAILGLFVPSIYINARLHRKLIDILGSVQLHLSVFLSCKALS